MSPPLERLARRLADEPDFLAAALARYAASEQLDDAALVVKLGCAAATLTALRLCRMPHSEAPLFQQDVTGIAERFQVNPEILAEIVRRGQALIRLQGPSPNPVPSSGVLLAARDRPPSPPPAPPEGGGR